MEAEDKVEAWEALEAGEPLEILIARVAGLALIATGARRVLEGAGDDEDEGAADDTLEAVMEVKRDNLEDVVEVEEVARGRGNGHRFALERIAFFVTIDSFVDGAQKPLEVAEEAEDEEFEEDALEAVAVAKDDDESG